MSQRSDAKLIKFLAQRFGYQTAAEWQTPPLVLLPAEGFGEHLIAHIADYEPAISPIDRLPWRDVVLDFPHGRGPIASAVYGVSPHLVEALDRGHLWVRVRPLSDLLRDLDRTNPWWTDQSFIFDPFRAHSAHFLAVEVWEESTALGEFAPWPDLTLIPVASPLRTETWAYLYTNPLCRGDRAYGAAFCNTLKCRHPEHRRACLASQVVLSLGTSLALGTIGYLLSSDEYPVEVRNAPPRNRRARPDPRLTEKPWLREDLPHVILIDPRRVREYRSEPQGGTHASPHPHQRRGHWRQLRAERFKEKRRLWVRPAWIGDVAWQHEGQVYKVIGEKTPGPPLFYLSLAPGAADTVRPDVLSVGRKVISENRELFRQLAEYDRNKP